MTDMTYRDAVNLRLAQLYAGPSADHGERAWGEGEMERMERFVSRSVNGIWADLIDAIQSACRLLVTEFQNVLAAIATVQQANHERSVANRALPVRLLPTREPRPSLKDQRPAIRRHYARRHY